MPQGVNTLLMNRDQHGSVIAIIRFPVGKSRSFERFANKLFPA
jgi:hypothetical protein